MSIELSRDELLMLYDLFHRLEDAAGIFEVMAEPFELATQQSSKQFAGL